MILFWICFVLAFLPITLCIPVKVKGKNNLKKLGKKNCIISCNHMSNLDCVMLDIKLVRRTKFLAKIELFKNWFVRFVLKSFGGIPVNREAVDPTTIKQVYRILNNNENLAIFPQGTRKKTPQITSEDSKAGVAMFAIRTNTPVVPMMFDKKIRLFHKTNLIIGEPIYPDETKKKDKEYVTEFSNLIVEKMNSLLENTDENERL